jgi:hypothetical protein
MGKRKLHFEDMGIGQLLRLERLAVPPNQRSYAWRTHHVTDLLQDLSAAINNDDDDYFLGTIVLIGQGKMVPLIADGQQRLATVSILFARIRDLFVELKRDKSAASIDRDYLRNEDVHTEESVPHLQLNVEDNSYFSDVILPPRGSSANTGTRLSNRRLYQASEVIDTFLRGLLVKEKDSERINRLLRWIDFLKDNASIIAVTVPDEVGAFRIFETLNDRGLRASQADILKNYLFSKAGKRMSEAQRLWDGMSGTIEGLGGDDADDKEDETGGRLVTYLRHLWILGHGHTREKDLASGIKSEITGETKALRFLADANDAAPDYVALWSVSHKKWNAYKASVRHSLTTINEHLKLEQIRPLLFAVARSFTPEEAEKAYRLFVSWSVRFLVYGGRGGFLDKHYAERANEIGSGRVTKARQLREHMKEVVPTDGQFQGAFATARVSKSHLARYFLRVIDQMSKPDDLEPEYVPNEDASQINLEHVMPLTPGPEWKIDAETAVAGERLLGNMVLLRAGKNKDLGNASFEEKKKVYKESGYTVTTDVAEYDEWGLPQIRQRQAEMANVAVKAWPLTFGD